MYGVKFSLWLTGAVGPQAVAGRHLSTRPLAGGVYIESGRRGCWPPVFAWRDGVASPAGKPGKLPGRVGRHPRRPDSMETAGGRCTPSRHHTGPDCTSIGELKNLVINYHLQSYVMDRSMVFVFFKFRRVLKK